MMGVLSLYSGCGGCSLGLKQAGFEVSLAADIDKDACDTYASNLGKAGVWQIDLSNITPTELLKRSQINLTDLNLIVGGPPCQGFSSAGSKDWTDPRNVLLRNFVEIVTSLRPTWFIMENVEGLLTANEGIFIIEAISRFLDAGYWVRAKKVYMEQHGLPQRRKRVVIVGNLERCNFHFPQPTYWEQPTLPTVEQQVQLRILDAIDDLPAASDTGEVFYEREPQNDYQRWLRRTDDLPVTIHQIKRLNQAAQQRIRLLKQGETMKQLIHPTKNHPLTLRECAHSQSLPVWYESNGSCNSIATQIGNAIPPMFMELLARHIRNLATWHRAENPRGRWLGIEATKSNGMSPALIKVLTELEERTYVYAYI